MGRGLLNELKNIFCGTALALSLTNVYGGLEGATVTNACIEYVVREKDTFYSIAKKQGTTVAEIQELNLGIDPKKIFIGSKMRIPAGSTNMPTVNTYDFSRASLNIEWHPSSHFKPGRVKSIEGIVVHSTEGYGKDAVRVLDKRKVSAHYLVMENGGIKQLVKDEDTAWHAGRNANSSYIGVEFAGFGYKQGFEFSEEQYQKGGRLISSLIKKHGVLKDKVVSHKWVTENLGGTTHVDPGPNFDWEKLWQYMKKE